MGRKPSKRKTIPKLGIDPSKFDQQAVKSVMLSLRITPEERDEVGATAKSLGVSVGDYVLNLHRQAVEALRRKRGGR